MVKCEVFKQPFIIEEILQQLVDQGKQILGFYIYEYNEQYGDDLVDYQELNVYFLEQQAQF